MKPKKPLTLNDLKVIVVGDSGWGRGRDYTAALRNCLRDDRSARDKHRVYLVHPNTVIDEISREFISPDLTPEELALYAPKLVHQVGPATVT